MAEAYLRATVIKLLDVLFEFLLHFNSHMFLVGGGVQTNMNKAQRAIKSLMSIYFSWLYNNRTEMQEYLIMIFLTNPTSRYNICSSQTLQHYRGCLDEQGPKTYKKK